MRTDAQQGILMNIVVGIIGAVIAGLILGKGNINQGLTVETFLWSLLGAVGALASRVIASLDRLPAGVKLELEEGTMMTHNGKVQAGKRDITLGLRPYGVTIHPSGRFAVAASVGRGTGDTETLSVIDLTQNPPRAVDTIEVVGIATDHCVRATALDAAAAGLATTVRLDLTAGVAQSTVDSTLRELQAAGVTLVGEPVVR